MKEYTITKQLQEIIIASFELQTYLDHNLRQTEFDLLLKLYSNLTYYLDELQDNCSLISFYLPEEDRAYHIDLYLKAKPLIELHLEDALMSEYTSIPAYTIYKARRVVNSLQHKSNLTLDEKQTLAYHELYLEYTTPIHQINIRS